MSLSIEGLLELAYWDSAESAALLIRPLITKAALNEKWLNSSGFLVNPPLWVVAKVRWPQEDWISRLIVHGKCLEE